MPTSYPATVVHAYSMHERLQLSKKRSWRTWHTIFGQRAWDASTHDVPGGRGVQVVHVGLYDIRLACWACLVCLGCLACLRQYVCMHNPNDAVSVPQMTAVMIVSMMFGT